MIARVKEYAIGYAKRKIRRYLIQVGVGTVVVGGSLAYRAVTGAPDDAGTPAPRARHAAIPVARTDTARSVALASASAPAPAPAEAPAQQLGIPNIKNSIDKAHNAADATNRNIAEQTGQAVKSSRGTPAPAVTAPRSGPGSVPAVPATGAAAAAAAASAVPPVTREVFSYSAEGRRDPFFSLILTEDLRPLLSDLKLVGILYEASGKRSVAIMRDLQTNAQYRVAAGQTLGRMRVTQIKPKGVIFSIDEFGLSRQDSLVLTDTTKVRN